MVAREMRDVGSSPRPTVGVGDAVEHVYEAGQQLLARRVELWLAEARLLARSGGGIVLAGVLGLAGWFYLCAGAIEGLARSYPRFAVQIGVGGFHMLLAAVLFVAFRRAAARAGGRS